MNAHVHVGCRRPVPAIQRRGPGPEPDLPPAHTGHRCTWPQRRSQRQSRARQARPRPLGTLHGHCHGSGIDTRILCAPTPHLRYMYARSSHGGQSARPSAIPVCATHMLADRRSQRPSDLAAAVAPAPHAALLCSRSHEPPPSGTPPPSSSDNPVAGKRNDQARDKEAVFRRCTHGFGATGRWLQRLFRLASSPVRCAPPRQPLCGQTRARRGRLCSSSALA